SPRPCPISNAMSSPSSTTPRPPPATWNCSRKRSTPSPTPKRSESPQTPEPRTQNLPLLMLAQAADNFAPPAAIAAWLACAAFTLWFLLLVDKAVQRLRGKAPQPPNRQLEAGQLELHRRVAVLEEWKDGLLQKLDADKSELLAAGGRREEKLSAEISGVA